MKAATIYGREIKPEVGSVIRLDCGVAKRLLPGDGPFADGWRCDFRWPNPVPGWEEKHAIALNVDVTGRTKVRWGGEWWVRVRLTWVGDCSPDVVTGGWLRDTWA